jgi:hypothetical protein
MQKVKEEIDTVLAGVEKAMAAEKAERLTSIGGDLPAEGLKMLSSARKAVETYGPLVRSTYDQLEKLRLNDTMYPEGRKRMMQELLTDAEDKTEQKHDTADANAKVAYASFIVSAFPKLARSEEMIARQDARMILDASKEPDHEIARLALRQDAVGALVVTSWGADYLHSRGYDERLVKDIQTSIVGMALDGAIGQAADDGRSKAARGAKAAQSLAGMNDAAASAVRGLLSSMRNYYGVPREADPKPRDPRRPAAPQVLGEDIPSFNF